MLWWKMGKKKFLTIELHPENNADRKTDGCDYN